MASLAWTRQYQVPLGNVAVQLVPVRQLDWVLIEEKDELLLTCTRYSVVPPLGLVEAYQLRPIEQPEEEEHLPSGSALRTGAVGGLIVVGAETVKLSTADQEETSDVLDALRAWTRQYQMPVPKVGVQLVALIHPDE